MFVQQLFIPISYPLCTVHWQQCGRTVKVKHVVSISDGAFGGQCNLWDSTSSTERNTLRWVSSWRKYSDSCLYHQRKLEAASRLTLLPILQITGEWQLNDQLLGQCFLNSLLADLFWLRKVITDPYILSQIVIKCPNDKYTKLKLYSSLLILDSNEYN
jgi:hypothetical protein